MSHALEGLPDRRRSLRGRHLDGQSVELVFSISKKPYVCPGCRAQIELGAEHVLVHFEESDGESWHEHWHRRCAHTILIRELRDAHPTPVHKDGRQTKGQRRKATLDRRRSR
jgi:hypothetical protein